LDTRFSKGIGSRVNCISYARYLQIKLGSVLIGFHKCRGLGKSSPRASNGYFVDFLVKETKTFVGLNLDVIDDILLAASDQVFNISDNLSVELNQESDLRI